MYDNFKLQKKWQSWENDLQKRFLRNKKHSNFFIKMHYYRHDGTKKLDSSCQHQILLVFFAYTLLAYT